MKKTTKTPKAPKETKEPKAPKAKREVEHRHISELSKKDREVLEVILRKDAGAITEEDLGVLNARKAYLTSDEIEKYDL